jgi:hypothetical protein
MPPQMEEPCVLAGELLVLRAVRTGQPSSPSKLFGTAEFPADGCVKSTHLPSGGPCHWEIMECDGSVKSDTFGGNAKQIGMCHVTNGRGTEAQRVDEVGMQLRRWAFTPSVASAPRCCAKLDARKTGSGCGLVTQVPASLMHTHWACSKMLCGVGSGVKALGLV